MITKLFIDRCLADDFRERRDSPDESRLRYSRDCCSIFSMRAPVAALIRTDFSPSLAYQVVVLAHLHCIYFGLHAVS